MFSVISCLENTTRYGANKTKHLSVKGSIPRVVPRDPLEHQTQVCDIVRNVDSYKWFQIRLFRASFEQSSLRDIFAHSFNLHRLNVNLGEIS